MKLRARLLLLQLPSGLALAGLAATAMYVGATLGQAPAAILHANFRSIEAAQGMLDALASVEAGAAPRSPLTSTRGAPRSRAELEADFEGHLRLQVGNVTEPGEAEDTAAVRFWWDVVRGSRAAPAEVGGDAAGTTAVALARLRGAVGRIMAMNREAMVRKSREARDRAVQLSALLAAASVLALLAAGALSALLLRRFMRRIDVLDRGVRRMVDGDLAVRLRLSGADELSELAGLLNHLVRRLDQYRRSSLGEALRARRQLEATLEAFEAMVVVYGLDGEGRTANRAAVRALGQEGVARAEDLPEWIRPAVSEALDWVRTHGEPWEERSVQGTDPGSGGPPRRWWSFGAAPVRTEEGVLEAVAVTLRDVSRGRRLEALHADLVQAAASELRSPLTSLHMALHLCLEEAVGPLTPEQRDLLVTGRGDCERLEDVVTDLVELADLHVAGGATTTVGVDTLLAQVEERVGRPATGPRVRVEPSGTPVELAVDVARLARALTSLVEAAGARGARHLVLRGRSVEGGVDLEVEDDGPPPAPGARGAAGHDLGRVVVENLIRDHGGSLFEEAGPRGGTLVRLHFPEAGERGGAVDGEAERVPLRCPKCGGALEVVEEGGLGAERCAACRGLWFASEVHLGEVPPEVAAALDEGAARGPGGLDELREVDCPLCRTRMLELVSRGPAAVHFERCGTCRGVFLDAGELSELRGEKGLLDMLRTLFAVDLESPRDAG